MTYVLIFAPSTVSLLHEERFSNAAVCLMIVTKHPRSKSQTAISNVCRHTILIGVCDRPAHKGRQSHCGFLSRTPTVVIRSIVPSKTTSFFGFLSLPSFQFRNNEQCLSSLASTNCLSFFSHLLCFSLSNTLTSSHQHKLRQRSALSTSKRPDHSSQDTHQLPHRPHNNLRQSA